jgi:hypothetical protein
LVVVKSIKGVATEFERDRNVENSERTSIQSLGESRSETFGSVKDLIKIKRLPG